VASALFNFGIDNEYCSLNPAARMKRIGKAKAFAPGRMCNGPPSKHRRLQEIS